MSKGLKFCQEAQLGYKTLVVVMRARSQNRLLGEVREGLMQ